MVALIFHAFNASTALVFFIIEMANFYGQVSFPIAQLIQLLFSNCLVKLQSDPT